MMKLLIVLLALIATAAAFARDVYVQPYVRSDGTFVQGHYRTAPDGNPFNNYSTQGNVNPYTGQAGTVNPYANQIQPAYVQPLPPVPSLPPLPGLPGLPGFQPLPCIGCR
jgi:hypothetical protein